VRFVLVLVLVLVLVPLRAEAGRGTSLLKYLSDDTRLVVVIDVAHARGGKLFERGLAVVKKKLAAIDALGDIEKLCDTIVIGFDPEHHRTVIAVEGRVDKLAHAKELGGLAVAYLDKRLVLAQPDELPHVVERARGKAKARGAATMIAMLAAATPSSDVFGALAMDGDLATLFQPALDAAPEWLAFSFAGGERLSLDLRLKLPDEAAATHGAGKLAAQLADTQLRTSFETTIGKDFSDSITVDRERALVRISATMTADEVARVASLLETVM
jgi:hypothetical protein